MCLNINIKDSVAQVGLKQIEMHIDRDLLDGALTTKNK